MNPTLLTIASGIAGLVFGIGLVVSSMFNPAKVLAFLDLAGRWDPSLALVMVGAVAIATAGCGIAGRRQRTLLGAPLQLSSTRDIDLRLVLGSATFGVGWGLVGFCPGPALVALGTGEIKAIVFAASMIAGMLVFEAVERARKAASEAVAQQPMSPGRADG
jgi:uncharacterized membrane protein YedE/YeeE